MSRGLQTENILRFLSKFLLLVGAALWSMVFSSVAQAQCYGVADSDKITSSDELVFINPMTGASTPLGSLGTLDVEAIALSPDGAVLYGVDGGQMGTIDTATGAFSALASSLGTADGAAGSVLLDDVDSLTFDPLIFDPPTGELYGVHRTAGAATPDLLVRIDPVTGGHVADAFGSGVDYVEIPVILGLESIDDIAISPLDGQMYGIANDDPAGLSDRLVRIDKATGAVSDVGSLGVADVEGLSFGNDGTLYASTGADAPFGELDRFYTVDTATGAATEVALLLGLFEDYEALACLSAGVNLISGTVFADLDRDAVHDDPAEPGEPGVAVRLYRDLDGDGRVSAGDVLIRTVTTDAGVDYAITVAADGPFVLDIDRGDLPPGNSLTTDNLEEAVFVGFGNVDPDNDFGFAPVASVGDRIWLDLDGDGIQDIGEAGIPGVSVEIFDATGVSLGTTTTDSGGFYIFRNLDAGTYFLIFGVPPGTVRTPDNQGGDDELDSDASPVNGASPFFDLVAGQDRTDIDAGVVPDSSLGDRVWLDLNGDGIQDVGESGVAGVGVELLTVAGTVLATTTTDASGFYLFPGLPAGNYLLRFTPPAGYNFSPRDQGDESLDSDADPATGLTGVIPLGIDEDRTDVDAGLNLLASVGNFVWQDRDGDGIQDVGEVGVAGVAVQLFTDGGVPVASTVTAGDGSYLFEGLAPGSYTVTFTPPAGSDFTIRDQGGDESLDSDADPATGQTEPFSLAAGENRRDVDAGLVILPPTLTCWAAADTGDQLVSVSGGLFVTVGPLGASDVEALALDPITGTLFGADGGQLGTVDTATGVFTALAAPFGSGDGAFGSVFFDDVDALAFDPLRGFFYGVHRRIGDGVADLLLLIDAATGAHVADAFGAGVDYLPLGIVAGLEDIDDLAVSPVDGRMFGIINDDATGDGDRLVVFDPATGAATDVGSLGVADVEGLAFSSDGRLFATTGDAGAAPDSLFLVDPATAVATSAGLFPEHGDYEGLACLSDGFNTIEGTVFFDNDLDGELDPVGEPGTVGVTVILYLDNNNDGVVDGGDTPLQIEVTGPGGEYSFEVGGPGNFVVAVDPTTLPPAFDFTSDNVEEGDFLTVGGSDPDNDFGVAPEARIGNFVWLDADGDGIQDGGEAAVQGVLIELFDIDGNLVATTTTDADGFYEFRAFGFGTFFLRFTPPAGYFFTARDQGDDDEIDSDAVAALGEVVPFDVTSGTFDFSFDTGLREEVTEAVVTSLRAYPGDAGVIVEWQTSSESGTAGFFLFRLDGSGQVAVGDFVPGLVDAPAGGIYRQLDDRDPDLSAPRRGEMTYALVEMDLAGRQVMHGPFRVVLEDAAGAGPEFGSAERRPISVSFLERSRRQREEVRAWRGERAARIGPGQIEALKLEVREDGIYFLSAEEIAESLDEPTARVRGLLRRGGLALSLAGEDIAWTAALDGLAFFGEKRRSVYGDENVYWLRRAEGLVMEDSTSGGSECPASGETASPALEHWEEDRFAATALARDPEGDYWHWELLVSGHATHGRKSFATLLWDLAREASAAELAIDLRGASDFGIAGEHRVEALWNGTSLGESRWEAFEAHRARFSVPADLLREGDNEVEVVAHPVAGVPYSVAYLDSMSLVYERRHRAVAEVLALRTDDSLPVSAGGFREPPELLLDVRQARRPHRLLDVAVRRDEDGYRLCFLPATPRGEYRAASAAGLRSPAKVGSWRSSGLRSPALAADYLLIAPAFLAEAAEGLAALRRAQGLSARVVSLEDVVDEFHDGLPGPTAVRAFLAWAYENWRQPPRYVLLVGRGTYDYRDLQGLGDSLVPPLLVATPDGLFTSDLALGDVVGGDDVPEIAIGRLPVLTAGEVETYLRKVEAYEAGGRGRALMVADEEDSAGSFAATSESLVPLFPNHFAIQRIYLGQMPLGEARAELFTALASGVDWINYAGHGGVDRLSDEGLLTLADVPSTAGAEPSVTVATSCLINRFELPGFPSLGETLVVEPGGSVAVFAPTGLSVHSQSIELNRLLLEEAFGPSRPPRLGEVILRASRALASLGGIQAVGNTYVLLGDPALQIR